MRYTVEIDTKSKEGSEALKYLRTLKAGKVIAIHQWRKLHPADIALPNGLKPTAWQWEEYLNQKQSKATPAKKAFSNIRKKLERNSGK